MVLVMVTGNIDLSVGKLAGFVSVVVAQFQADIWFHYIPNNELLTTVFSVLIGIAVGTIFEVLQGYIISYLHVPAFIVTLGGQWILNGGILIITGGRTIPANQPFFSVIAQGYFSPTVGWILSGVVILFMAFSMLQGRRNKIKYGFKPLPMVIEVIRLIALATLIVIYVAIVNRYNGVQIPVMLLAITAVIMSYVSTNTPVGRYAYAIGGNCEAARLSGVNISRNIFLVFVLMA
jgi:D-xylose transport system permease protein